ncbi:hypothetical protein GWI33_022943 [Rhynchophorus ferrugineus]|uniref:Uncharacterized protein n=1 Tax=Rhynchophorus ferrugineus TaxID=354439 RepID=A0A834IMG6_RHYFE|nr:hypothetical protein GWI33_022943 [Rhynchophorus ferrugineus]
MSETSVAENLSLNNTATDRCKGGCATASSDARRSIFEPVEVIEDSRMEQLKGCGSACSGFIDLLRTSAGYFTFNDTQPTSSADLML